MVGLNEKAIEAGETPRRGAKPFRILIEQIELASKFGSVEDLELACNELLSSVKYDTFTGFIRRPGSCFEEVVSSSNPVVVFEKLSQYRGEELAGVSVEVTCGHCQLLDKARFVTSSGTIGASHIDNVLDNFPEEI